jgi:hypothetical protein
MTTIPIEIVRFVDESQPGHVECVLTDAAGQRHRIIEKVPVVTREDLRSDSTYPRYGVVACQVESEWTDSSGRALARVNTEQPWGIESTEGTTNFIVLSSLLAHDDSRG